MPRKHCLDMNEIAGWACDRVRRAEAHVPQEVGFATKPQQAIAMLVRAWEHGVPMRWVTGDEVYGDSPRLRETIQEHGRFYVLAVSANTRVWTERPAVEEPEQQTGGRPRLAPRVAKGAPKARMVSEVIASLPTSAWKRLAVVEGEKGLITYHWARVGVVESRDQLPGPDVWLLARRSPSTPDKLAYYLAYAPSKTSLETLVRVAVEQLAQAPEDELWLIADGSDLRKPYAQEMPALMQVRDLEGHLVPGYRTLNVLGVTPGRR